MSEQEPIVVLYCIDDAYLPQAGIALASLLDSNRKARFEIVVAAIDRNRRHFETVFGAVLAKRRHAALSYVDLDDGLFADLRVTKAFSRSAYTRIILQRFIDARHARVLYLDADTIVRGDITPLWQADLGGATIGAVPDHFRLDAQVIGFDAGEPYFNSGMILIDMARWRERNCEQRVLDVLARRGHELPWMDQDALNIALRGEVRFLDLVWNWQPRCADVPAAFLGLDEVRYAAVRTAPKVVHYTTSFKPWNAAYRVHYSTWFFTAARASGIPAQYLPACPPPRGLAQRLMQTKTSLRWGAPWAFRTMRRLLKPEAAAAMYRAGPSE
jgi:lipopolysaccharide biosynthesis glycosyltransferase